MDELEKKLADALKSIPGGGFGEMGAYGMHRESIEAARIIRQMIDQAVAEALKNGR